MKDKVKQLASGFFTEFGIRTLDLKTLEEIIKKQGYKIVEYNRFSNIEAVASLLAALKLSDYSKTVDAFTYADSVNRIVFITEGLSDRERFILLSHEEGHIYSGHISSQNSFAGTSIINENEANEFAYLITHRSPFKRINSKKVYAVAAALVVLALLIVTVAVTSQKGNKEEYYITKSGQKYHTAQCTYIKGKDNVQKLPLNELIKLGYEPCGICVGN